MSLLSPVSLVLIFSSVFLRSLNVSCVTTSTVFGDTTLKTLQTQETTEASEKQEMLETEALYTLEIATRGNRSTRDTADTRNTIRIYIGTPETLERLFRDTNCRHQIL